MLNKKLLGLKSKKQGSSAERLFSDMCKIQGILHHRIEDGGFYTGKKKIFVRTKQLCDFVLFIKDAPFFIDIKSTDNIIPSMFFNNSGKETSTQRQAKNFMKIYRHTTFSNLGFIFLNPDSHIPDLKSVPFRYVSAKNLCWFKNSKWTSKDFKIHAIEDLQSLRSLNA